jgi:hypothetical protein
MGSRYAILAGLAAVFAAAPALAADDPAMALVELVDAAPKARVRAYDYLRAGDEVDLRPGGTLSIAYFDACVVDTFTGGVVKLSKSGGKVKGGKQTRAARPCQTAALAPQGKEAGAAAIRIREGNPLSAVAQREISIAVERPTFVWPRAAGEAKVSLHLLEAKPKTLVWSSASAANVLAYPADAPALTPGVPYEVTVEVSPGKALSAVFSIDPGLDLPPGPLTTAVLLGR